MLLSDEEATLKRFIETFIDEINVIILSDYDKGIFKSESFIRYLADVTAKAGLTVIAQSRANQIEKFDWADHLLISAKHAVHVINLRTKKEIANIQALGRKIQEFYSFKSFTIYDSADQDIALFNRNGDVIQYQKEPVQLIDQTGMGDVILTVIGMSMSSGASPEESLILAHRGFMSAGRQIGTGQIFKKNLLDV